MIGNQGSATLLSMNEKILPDPVPFTTGASVVLLIAGVGAGFTIATLFSLAQYGLQASGSDWKWISKLGLLVGTAIFILPTIFYARRRKKSLRRVLRLRPVSGTVLLSTFILSIGLVVMTDAVDKAISPAINAYLDRTIGTLSPELLSDHILEKMSAEFKIHDWWSGLLLILAAVGAAAFCEETLIRGVFQQALEKRMRSITAITLSSIVFATIHFNPWGGIQILLIAVVLGCVAWRTDSVVPSMLIHALNNGIVLLANNLDDSTTSWYGTPSSIAPPVLVIGLVFFIGGSAGLWRSTRANQEVLASSPQ